MHLTVPFFPQNLFLVSFSLCLFLFFQLKSILRFCLVMFDMKILYIYILHMCARRRDITIARINIYTYICQATRRDYVFLINKIKNKKKKNNVGKNAIIFEGIIMDFSLFALLVQSFFLKIKYHYIICYTFSCKKIINIFLFLHKLFRNIIIKHGKCSLSTTIFFLFFQHSRKYIV